MKNMKEIMIKAHKMTKEIVNKYGDVDYKAQLGVCISYICKEGANEMVELKGSEKQIKWAKDIRKGIVKNLEDTITEYEKDRTKCEEEGTRYSKRATRYEKALRALLEEIKANDSSKFFIENYAYHENDKNFFYARQGNVEF